MLAQPSNGKNIESIHLFIIYLNHIAFIKPFVQSFWLNTQRKEKLLSLEEMYDKQRLISYLHMYICIVKRKPIFYVTRIQCNSCASCICGSTIMASLVCVCLVCMTM